jgi:hypothetical protein
MSHDTLNGILKKCERKRKLVEVLVGPGHVDSLIVIRRAHHIYRSLSRRD